DINATNPTLWNSWRASLMHTLYHQTKSALQRGLGNPVNRSEWVKTTIDEALTILAEGGIDEARAKAIWTDLDEEFFLRERAGVIARCTQAIYNANADV